MPRATTKMQIERGHDGDAGDDRRAPALPAQPLAARRRLSRTPGISKPMIGISRPNPTMVARPNRTAQLVEENFSASLVLPETAARAIPEDDQDDADHEGPGTGAGCRRTADALPEGLNQGEHPESDRPRRRRPGCWPGRRRVVSRPPTGRRVPRRFRARHPVRGCPSRDRRCDPETARSLVAAEVDPVLLGQLLVAGGRRCPLGLDFLAGDLVRGQQLAGVELLVRLGPRTRCRRRPSRWPGPRPACPWEPRWPAAG